MSELHILGIRHHGPGSTRSVLGALQQLQPDLLLVEGPPDAEEILPMLLDLAMQPPIAMLVYAKTDTTKAAYFPFAEFSPEYQAIRYALQQGIPVRLMDLPQRYMLAQQALIDAHLSDKTDPLSELAQAAGYDDAERWWDAMVEQRHDSLDPFEAIQEAMTALREAFPDATGLNQLREAYMRYIVSSAQQEGYTQITVVCGAWHGPALRERYSDADARLLSDLEEIAVAATWIPWTHSRLARHSGYGAGVESPGWYRYLWEATVQRTLAMGWLTKVAQHLRKHGLDASPAQVIDAVHLVETLAAVRGRSRPDLHDLNEAALSVLCHGNEAPMQVILRDLIVGEVMGRVPDGIPMVPLQRDFQYQVERFGLTISEAETELVLDLRNARDREISRFLYRLMLLHIEWATLDETDIAAEAWTLYWHPSVTIHIIDKSVWGVSIEQAASAFAAHQAQTVDTLPTLTELTHQVLFADLSQAIPVVLQALENSAATTGEVSQLMKALPPLAGVLVYGDIRQTNTTMVRKVTDSLAVRIQIGLPAECNGLDDDAASGMMESIMTCNSALGLLNSASILHNWYTLLQKLMNTMGIHGFIGGRCCRIVLDAELISNTKTVRQMRLALGRAAAPKDAADWLQGFLSYGGAVLIYDDNLLAIIDEWVMSLSVDEFEAMLPLIRRTFSTFEEAERSNIGRRISGKPLKVAPVPTIDAQRADEVDTTLNQLLGLKGSDNA